LLETTVIDSTEAVVVEPRRPTLRRSLVVRSAFGSFSGVVGLTVVVLLVGISFIGPSVAPHGENDVVGLPFQGPSADYPLGTDVLGRDGLTRYLYGGRTLVLVAVASTALAYLVGISIAMASAYRRGFFDLATIAITDVILSFPPIIFVLLLVAAAGPRLSVIVLGMATIHVPRVVRIVRAVTLEVVALEFVEAAVARGERLVSILWREILPNIWTPLLADFGIRLSGSVWLFSALSFLGLGQAPPASDWGLMISENRIGLTIQPWIVFVPAMTIALLTVGVSLLADAINRNLGRSTLVRGV